MSTNEMILLAVIVVAIGYAMYGRLSETRLQTPEAAAKVPPRYAYTAKDHMMTDAEAEFFAMLQQSVGDRYYVFPQVHLSVVLDHKSRGQNWTSAFRHINGKSVDYVLCEKTTFKPAYAVELDDPTHNRTDRQKRDREVERIFEGTDLKLVRFRSYRELTNSDLRGRFL